MLAHWFKRFRDNHWLAGDSARWNLSVECPNARVVHVKKKKSIEKKSREKFFCFLLALFLWKSKWHTLRKKSKSPQKKTQAQKKSKVFQRKEKVGKVRTEHGHGKLPPHISCHVMTKPCLKTAVWEQSTENATNEDVGNFSHNIAKYNSKCSIKQYFRLNGVTKIQEKQRYHTLENFTKFELMLIWHMNSHFQWRAMVYNLSVLRIITAYSHCTLHWKLRLTQHHGW